MGCGCSKTAPQNTAVVPFEDGSSHGKKRKKRKTARSARQSQRNEDSTDFRSSSSSSPPNGVDDGPTVLARELRSPRSPQAAGKRRKRKRRGVTEKEKADAVGASGSPTPSTSGQHELASDPEKRTGSVAQTNDKNSEAIHGGKEKVVDVQILYPVSQADGLAPPEESRKRSHSRGEPKKSSSSRQASPRHSPRQPPLGQEPRPHGVVVASQPPAENPLAGPLQNSPMVPQPGEKEAEKSFSSVGISVANSSRPGMSRAKVMRVQAWIDAASVTDLLDPQDITQQIQREQLALNFMQQPTGSSFQAGSAMTGSTTSSRTVKASQFRSAFADSDLKNQFVPLAPSPSPQAAGGGAGTANQQRTPPQVSAFVEHQPSAEFLLPGAFEGSDTSGQMPLRPGSPNPEQPSTSVRTNADPMDDFASPR